jgi:two-component sensor histidine kinase
MVVTANGQVNGKDTQIKLIELGLDSSNQNNSAYAKQLINAWVKLGREENKYNPYIVLPIKTWEVIFEKQYNKNNNPNLKAIIGIHYSSILLDLSQYDKAIGILQFSYKERKNIPSNEYKILLNNLEQYYKSKSEIAKAILIRNELIENKLISNYWRIYKACGLNEAALEDFNLFEEKKYYIGNKKILKPNYYNNLSRLFFANKNTDSAIIYAELGLANIEDIMQDKSIQFLNKNEILTNWKALYIGFLGKCDMTNKDYLKAIPKLKYAIDNGKIDIESNALSMIYLSLCYLNLNDLNNYKLYSDSVRNKINSIDAEDVIRSYYSASQQYFAKIKKYDSAYKYLTLHSQYKDRLTKGVQQNQSILLLGQLEIQKRRSELTTKNLNLIKIEKENKNAKNQIWILGIFIGVVVFISITITYFLLQSIKNKKLISQKNNELSENIKLTNEQISKNDFLLKELHHRVKNNLQLMYSLLNLQKRRNNNLEIKSNLSTVQNRIQTMALVHEYLYNSGNFESVEAFKYIETLANHLKSIYKQENRNIVQIINIDISIQLPIEQIISLGLIINEIISNAYKYAFNDNKGSKLEITLAKINNLIVLEISDDGPGFSKDQINENSLGLKLIDIMCTQIKAKLTSSCTNGVSYNIEFTI